MTVTFATTSVCFSYFLFSGTSFYLLTAPLCKYCTKETLKFTAESETFPTFPGAHSVPSTGGPFLVLQKYWLSGWLHHNCLQGS